MMRRREFLKNTAAMTGAGAVSAWVPSGCVTPVRYPGYTPDLRDRLWMWGHDGNSLTGSYGLPAGGKIMPAEASGTMGIPNVCMIRLRNKPAPPFDEYVKQFARTKRLAWSIVDWTKEPYPEKKRMAFELADKLPNLTSIYLDDFFIGDAIPRKDEAPAKLTVAEIKALKGELDARQRPLDLSLVLYSNQLHPSIARHGEFCDVVSFWTWKASELNRLEQKFEAYRKIFPDKRTLLGIYMWDFGNSKPVTVEQMEHQCRLALQWFKEGKIEGMIFHCTILCDMKLEAVDYARKWIADHGNESRQCAVF